MRQAFNIAGEEISYYSGLVPRSPRVNQTAENREASTWNYRTDVDINYNNFPNWPEKYGHHPYGPGPDYYTSIIRWNLRSVFFVFPNILQGATRDDTILLALSHSLQTTHEATGKYRKCSIFVHFLGKRPIRTITSNRSSRSIPKTTQDARGAGRIFK